MNTRTILENLEIEQSTSKNIYNTLNSKFGRWELVRDKHIELSIDNIVNEFELKNSQIKNTVLLNGHEIGEIAEGIETYIVVNKKTDDQFAIVGFENDLVCLTTVKFECGI